MCFEMSGNKDIVNRLGLIGNPSGVNWQFDPEGSGYDATIGEELKRKWPLTIPKPSQYRGNYVTEDNAFQAWVWHPEVNDYLRHSGSLDPRTGMVLKGRGHKTYPLTEQAESELGNEMFRGPGGRTYSLKPGKVLVPQ